MVNHVPVAATILGDVRRTHVTIQHHQIRVRRRNGRGEHASATRKSHGSPGVRWLPRGLTFSLGGAVQDAADKLICQYDEEHEGRQLFHQTSHTIPLQPLLKRETSPCRRHRRIRRPTLLPRNVRCVWYVGRFIGGLARFSCRLERDHAQFAELCPFQVLVVQRSGHLVAAV